MATLCGSTTARRTRASRWRRRASPSCSAGSMRTGTDPPETVAWMASDRVDPFLQPESRRAFQRVQRAVIGAESVGGDAHLPAGPEHLARFRPELLRGTKSNHASDANGRAEMDSLHRHSRQSGPPEAESTS